MREWETFLFTKTVKHKKVLKTIQIARAKAKAAKHGNLDWMHFLNNSIIFKRPLMENLNTSGHPSVLRTRKMK